MVRIFLATANVGSVFENIEHGLEKWMNEFLKAVLANASKFVAVHFQETGGKNYQNCTNEIDVFFAELKRRFEEHEFVQVEGFVDSQSDLEDQYTALASTYYVHNDLDAADVQVWNFKEKVFTPVSKDGSESLHVGAELQNTAKKQKEKFPQDFFPDFKWSRKGFLRTRWRIKNVAIDLVNIHMFHDSCNLIAGSAFPSPFAQNRVKTLNYTLDKLLKNDDFEICPMFVFGDFNFRLNTYEIFEILRRELNSSDLSNLEGNLDQEKFISQDLLIESKVFLCPEHEKRFKHDFNWVRAYEFEAKQFTRLLERNLSFHPTYPFDEELPDKFMSTRCPAWCDRVLFTENANAIIAEKFQPVYDLIGSETCMGDHKPVYLSFDLQWTSEAVEFDASTIINTNEVLESEGNLIGNPCLQHERCNCGTSVASSTESSTDKCARLVTCFRKRFTLKRRTRTSKRRKTQENVLLESECDLEVKTCSSNIDLEVKPQTSRNKFHTTANDSDIEIVFLERKSNPKRSSVSVFRKCFTWKAKSRLRRGRSSVKDGDEIDKEIHDDYKNPIMCSLDGEEKTNNDDLIGSQTKTKLLSAHDVVLPPKLSKNPDTKLNDNLDVVEIQDEFHTFEHSTSLKEKREQITSDENLSGHHSAKCVIS